MLLTTHLFTCERQWFHQTLPQMWTLKGKDGPWSSLAKHRNPQLNSTQLTLPGHVAHKHDPTNDVYWSCRWNYHEWANDKDTTTTIESLSLVRCNPPTSLCTARDQDIRWRWWWWCKVLFCLFCLQGTKVSLLYLNNNDDGSFRHHLLMCVWVGVIRLAQVWQILREIEQDLSNVLSYSFTYYSTWSDKMNQLGWGKVGCGRNAHLGERHIGARIIAP